MVRAFTLLLTSTALILTTTAAQEPKKEADTKKPPSVWLLKKAERDAGNPLAKYAEMIRLEKDYLSDPMMGRMFPELKAMTEEELGDPHAFVRGVEFMRGREPEAKAIPEKAPFDGFEPTDAVEAIVAAAGERQAVMVGEEHHLPQTRSILVPLLRALKAKGFTHFAAETFNTKLEPTIQAGYPITESGTYSNDPVFADGIREALKLGYTLVPYEFDFAKAPPDLKPAERSAYREEEQAKNLKERLFDKAPKAKALIWAGRGHVSKANIGTLKMMAQHFQDKTGIEPYSVYGARFYESKPGFEDPLYRYATAKGLVTKPTIFVGPDGKAWPSGKGLDAQVFFPRVTLVEGRPDWLARDLGRQVYSLPQEMRHGEGLRLIQAHAANEPDRALAVDQVLWRPGEPAPALVLPPGKFRVRVIDPEGKELAKKDVEIVAKGS